MTPMISKEIMEQVHAIPEDSEEEVSENKTMRRRTAKKGKKLEF